MRAPTSRTLLGLLDEQAAHDAAATAVVTEAGSVSYGTLAGNAHRVAGSLWQSGVRRGDRVAVLTDNRAEWIEVAFGCAGLGAVLTPFNTWVKRWDLEYLLGHARPSVLVMVDRLGRQDFLATLREVVPELWDDEPGSWRSASFPDLRAVVVLGSDVPRGALAYRDWSSSCPRVGDGAEPDSVAMVLYTSGSSARPKAVPLVHRDLIANAWEIGERQGLSRQDRVFLASPLCWAFGSANAMMATLSHGATLVLQNQFDAGRAVELMEHQGCTAIYTLPAMTRALLEEPGAPERLNSVRRGVTIGPPAEVNLVRQALGVDLICNIYGSTETYGNCCVTPHDADPSRRETSQGPPLPGVEIRIAGAGPVGEIHVRGRVTPGFLDADGVPVPVVDQDGWFATGDLGSLDDRGWLTFWSRETEIIKTAGINVSPGEVEDFLASHPDVAEVAVAGGDDEIRGQRVVAFVRLRAGATVSAEDLRTFCATAIAGYKVPALVVLVSEFPTTQTGKLSRKELSTRATGALLETRSVR